MSIETLIEAAEYVDKVETTTATEETRTSDSQTMTSAKSNMKTSKDGTIQHWRKRAVAQSVMELSKATDVSENQSSIKNQTEPHSTTPVMKLPTLEESVFKKPFAALPATFIPTGASAISESSQNGASAISESSQNGKSTADTTAKPSTTYATIPSQHSVFNTVSEPHVYASVSFDSLVTRETVSSAASPQPDIPAASTGEHSGMQRQSLSDHDISSESTNWEISKKRSQLGAVTREAHNKLEKNRRAHLKGCFDGLRNIVPNLGAKVSNLVILREALKFVQVLKQRDSKLEKEREELRNLKQQKEQRLQRLKHELSKYMELSEVDDVLKKVGQNGTTQSSEATCNTNRSTLPAINNIIHPHQLGAFPPQATSAIPKHFIRPNPVLKSDGSSSAQKGENFNGVTSTTISCAGSINNVTPPASSSINLVWHNSNDSRRVCTMLPTPQMLTCAAIQKNPDEKVSITCASAQLQPLPYSPVTSLTHFKPIATGSQNVSNVKSYAGCNLAPGGMPNFMEGHPNPLKIVVKPVDSAKQQARVVKPISNHQKVSRITSTEAVKLSQKPAGQRPRQTELVFRPRSSITPPPPSNITPYFPRFSVGSGGSPPLTTILPNMNDGPNSSEENDNGDFAMWCARKDTGYGNSFSDNEKFMQSKRKLSTTVSGASVPKVSKVEIHVSKESPGQSVCFMQIVSSSRMSAPNYVLPTTFKNQGKSATQVCYSTLTSTKPAIPTSPSQLAKRNPAVQDVASVSRITPSKSATTVALQSIMMPTLPTMVVQNQTRSLQSGQFQLPATIMTPVLSHSSGQTATTLADPAASSKSSLNAVMGSRPTSASSCDSQNTQVKAALPQVQYVIPMGYPGMMTGPNGPTMAFPQPFGGFFPVMPQGQSWGYIMPQNMVIAQNSSKNTTTLTETPASSFSAGMQGAVGISPIKSPGVSMPTLNGNAPSPGKGIQPFMMAVPQPSVLCSNEKQNQPNRSPTPQQFQIVQPANQIMVPVAAEQSGGFIFGGAQAMVPTGQSGAVGYQVPMNIIGYPMQIGGSPSMQIGGSPSMQIGGSPSMQFAPVPQASFPRGFSFGFPGGIQPRMMAVCTSAPMIQNANNGTPMNTNSSGT